MPERGKRLRASTFQNGEVVLIKVCDDMLLIVDNCRVQNYFFYLLLENENTVVARIRILPALLSLVNRRRRLRTCWCLRVRCRSCRSRWRSR